MKSVFFANHSEFRDWLERHHASTAELWLQLRKSGSPKPGLTYAEALDQALCFGWIDGVRRSLDSGSFLARFTPRKPDSCWSAVNLRHFARLEKLGLAAPPGRAAFERRNTRPPGRYSFEAGPKALPSAFRKAFQADAAAWKFFRSQAPWYRRTSVFWVMDAKQEATRLRRLGVLMADSARSRRLKMLSRKPAL